MGVHPAAKLGDAYSLVAALVDHLERLVRRVTCHRVPEFATATQPLEGDQILFLAQLPVRQMSCHRPDGGTVIELVVELAAVPCLEEVNAAQPLGTEGCVQLHL